MSNKQVQQQIEIKESTFLEHQDPYPVFLVGILQHDLKKNPH